MVHSFITYLNSLARRCNLVAEKCPDARTKEEISAISVELVEYAEQLKSSPSGLSRH